MKAKDVMTTKVATVSPDNSVRQAAKVMLARRVSGLPVIDDDGRLVGLIRLEGKDVTATVTGGTVHLWGGVDTEDCRNAARVVAEGVRGVRHVIEHFPQREPPKRS